MMISNSREIPKVIHYCWFGGNPLPNDAIECIASWKKYFPGYEIKEWNESNFDLNCCDYVREAYEAKKWAFVSDYARFWILYYYGGLYFDTDVEVIKPFDDIIKRGAFIGCEQANKCAPGLGLGVNPGLGLFKEILDMYHGIHFKKENGDLNTNNTVVTYTTDIMLKHNWKPDGTIQEIDGVYIYPPEYFCPMDYITGKINITSNTYSIHHFTASWHSKIDDKIINISRFCVNHFGITKGKKIARILDFPLRVKKKVDTIGFRGALHFTLSKILNR